MIKLLAKAVKFRSELDEKMFFSWLYEVSAIANKYGEGTDIILEIKSQKISDDDLRELVGLFDRYDVDMRQLSQFLSRDNEKWFKLNTKSYWHKKVFG